MKKKNLLNEGQVRQFMKLANLEALSEEKLQEMGLDTEEVMEEEDSLEEADGEQLEEGEGKGPHREGAGKSGEQQGIAKNQGKEAKKTPDGKVDHSHADHKMKDLSVTKKAIEGGKPLTENEMPEDDLEMDDEEGMEMGGDEMGDEMLPGDDALDDGPEMGDDMGAPAPSGGPVDPAVLLKAIADAVAQVTGMEIEVNDEAGGEEELEMEPEGEPMDDLPPAPADDEMGMEDSVSSDEDDVMQEVDLSSVQTEALEAELEERKRVAESEKMTVEQKIDQIAESIFNRLLKSKK